MKTFIFVCLYFCSCVSPGARVWLCQCPPSRMDWPHIWLQAAGPSSSGGCKRVPPSLLWGPSWHLQHQWPSERDGHHRLHQQLWPDPQTGAWPNGFEHKNNPQISALSLLRSFYKAAFNGVNHFQSYFVSRSQLKKQAIKKRIMEDSTGIKNVLLVSEYEDLNDIFALRYFSLYAVYSLWSEILCPNSIVARTICIKQIMQMLSFGWFKCCSIWASNKTCISVVQERLLYFPQIFFFE